MATRAFDDWSPASVFGATAADKIAKHDAPIASPRRKDAVDEHELSVQQNNNDEHLTQSRQGAAGRATTYISKANVLQDDQKDDDNDPEGDQDPARDDDVDHAARVLQKHVRVWLLYRREVESCAHVASLRQQLTQVAGDAIASWYRRCRQRYAIAHYVATRRHERQAARCLWQWLRWQHCLRRARMTLQQRLVARTRLVCWWRRVLLTRRCDVSRERRADWVRDQDRAVREQGAARRVSRFVWRIHVRARAVRTATECVQSFLYRAVLRRRAAVEAQRRQRRRALVRVNRVVVYWTLRRTLSHWREHTRHERDAEEQRRHHRAACVLQRLVRVVLTAFRLMRRRDAATILQRVVRRRQAQRQYTANRHARRQRAAIHIQRLVRGHMARRRVAQLLLRLRERFKCQNCGLIEPGGVYCKFCGRRRTTFEILHAVHAAGTSTTESKLRRKRRQNPPQLLCPPPAPPVHSPTRDAVRPPPRAAPTVLLMTMPFDCVPPSPSREPLAAVVRSPKILRQDVALPSPLPPRKPTHVRGTSGRPTIHHRSLSLPLGVLPLSTSGIASADKTRQRAEALLTSQRSDDGDHASAAMALHLQRLQKGGKAASR